MSHVDVRPEELRHVEFLRALAVTFPEAVATAPEGLTAWWKRARTVQGEVRTAQKAATTTITHLGRPLARLAGSVLDERIKHLDTRPIHTSSAGVHTYQSPADRAAAAAARQRRWNQLAKDSDHKNSRDEDTEKSRREADVGLGLEDAGMFPPGSVSRAPAGGGDFVVTLPDGTQQAWDIKRVPSCTGPNPPVSLLDKRRKRDAYSTKVATRLIEKQLRQGRKVVMDSSQLSDDDRRALIDLIRSHSDWTDQVVVY